MLRKNRSRSSAAALELLLAVLFYWTHYACGKTLNARLEMPLRQFHFCFAKTARVRPLLLLNCFWQSFFIGRIMPAAKR